MTKIQGKFQFFLAALSAILLLMATPGTAEFSFLAWFGLVPLLWAIRSASPKRAFALGLFFGIIFFTGLIYWLTIVLGHYGHLPIWITIPALFLLVSYMSLYPAIFAAGVAWSSHRLHLLWGAPFLWVSLDYLRGKLFSGFPWFDLGYSQWKNQYLLQSADLFGHHGITFLIVLINCLVLTVLVRQKSTEKTNFGRLELALYLLPIILLFTGHVYGYFKLKNMQPTLLEAKNLSVTVVQGNIPQDEKWLPDFQKKTVSTYLSLSKAALAKEASDLVLWPETALPFYPLEHSLFKPVIQQMIVEEQTDLLTGVPHRELAGPSLDVKYINSAFLLTPLTSEAKEKLGYNLAGRYDKQHLVPFGEYIPLRKILPLPGALVETIADFSPGSSSQPLTSRKSTLGVLICFESIFPEIARQEVENGANLLVNLTNDAWFGDTSAPWQHLSMAIFRAVENRRSLARAANTGVSGFIDPTGKSQALSPLFETYTATAELPLLEDKTFFSRLGYLFPQACLFFLVPITLLITRQNKKAHFND